MPEIIPNWHPLFVHFTVALLITATGLFLLGTLASGKSWSATALKVAHINLWIGALVTIATVIAGLYAYNTVDHDTPSHLAMTDHRNWALPTAATFAVLAIWSAAIYRRSVKVGPAFLVVLLLATGTLSATAWKGGELVYRHGLGVMSMPSTSGSGEGHSGHAHPNGGHGDMQEKKNNDHAEHGHEEKEQEPDHHDHGSHDH